MRSVEAWARSAWEQRALLAALLYAQAWWIRRWMRLYDSAVLVVGLAGLTVTVSVMHSPAAAFAVAAFFGSIALTGLDNLLKESRRARRVSRALRRYGVDDALIEEARRSFAPRRSQRSPEVRVTGARSCVGDSWRNHPSGHGMAGSAWR
jgi:hypothetical protein